MGQIKCQEALCGNVRSQSSFNRVVRSPTCEKLRVEMMLIAAMMVNFRAANLDMTTSVDTTSNRKDSLSGTYLLPDRVLHPRHAARKTGLGMWTLCHHEIISRISLPGPHKQFLNRTKAMVGPDLHELVYIQLCQRIEQELELLHARIRGKNRTVETRLRQAAEGRGVGRAEDEGRSVLRRLSMKEAEGVRDGEWKNEGAVAFFDLGNMSDWSLDRADGIADSSSSIPLAELEPEEKAEASPSNSDMPFQIQIPVGASTPLVQSSKTSVPLYTPAAIFPQRLHRSLAELFAGIIREEGMEQSRSKAARHMLELGSAGIAPTTHERSSPSGTTQDQVEQVEHVEEMSDILVLSTYPLLPGSNRPGHYGVDLAIAFWRLRCFLGEGWLEYDADKRGRRV